MTRSRAAIPTPIRLTAWLASLVIVAALVGIHAPPARALTGQVLYGANGAGGNPSTNLYTLDPATGAIVATVGAIGFAVTGLAVDPTTGILYGTTVGNDDNAPGHLITIDKATGAGTDVGPLETEGTAPATDITFGADGTLYGWWRNGDDLVTIDLATGAATIVGDSGLRTEGGALAGSGDPLTLAGYDDDGCLHLINPADGTPTIPCATTLNGETGNPVNSADFNAAGTLFAVVGGGDSIDPYQLITINTASGAITVVGDTVFGLDAIAFNPALPLVATKTADAPTSTAGSANGYTITISNPNAAAATITSITDTLPAGFSYVAGSTTGATTANPSIAGSLLTWTGLFNAPAGGTVALSFDVIVSAVPGAYLNAAGGTAEGNSVTGTGPSAPIQVTAPSASINDVSVTEGNAGTTVNATFTVTLSSAPATQVTMSFATANGTAIAPADYQANSGTVTFVPGDVSETITITVAGDGLDEPNETFVVNLSAPVGATLADAQGTGTILDDDAPAAAALPDAATAEADGSAASSGWLLALGLLLGIAALSLRRSRARAPIRGR